MINLKSHVQMIRFCVLSILVAATTLISTSAKAAVAEKYSMTMGYHDEVTLSIKKYTFGKKTTYRREKKTNASQVRLIKIDEKEFQQAKKKIIDLQNKIKPASLTQFSNCQDKALLSTAEKKERLSQICLDKIDKADKTALLNWWKSLDQF